jgi:hypothetical protein
VTVTVRGTTLAATSDAQGRYQLNGVPVGDQVVRFSRAGYAAAVVTDVRVLPGEATPVNGTLRPEFYEMEEYEVRRVFQEQALVFCRSGRKQFVSSDRLGTVPQAQVRRRGHHDQSHRDDRR